MGAGIAKIFKKKFGRVNELKKQTQKVGEVAYIKKNGRYIFYLITKHVSSIQCKPSYYNLNKCLIYLRYLCRLHNVKKLAIPKIGCGLDQLHWFNVRKNIICIFSKENISITVYRK